MTNSMWVNLSLVDLINDESINDENDEVVVDIHVNKFFTIVIDGQKVEEEDDVYNNY